MAHFSIKNLSFSYPSSSTEVLSDVTFHVRSGEYIVITGKSGSGKSTLLRHLKTVLTPHGTRSGTILLDGIPLSDISLREQAEKIGFVMQNAQAQIVTDKVWHELAFGLENLGIDPVTIRLRTAEMASFFGIQNWFHKDVDTLSGGQKQLLNLAAIMAMQPEVLILDEPTSQLDPISASDFLTTLHKINTELGTTVIITEHRLEDILPCADRMIVLDHGKVIADNAPQAVSQQLWSTSHDLFPALPTPVRVFYESGSNGTCPLTVRDGRNWLSASLKTRPNVLLSIPEQNLKFEKLPDVLSVRGVWHRYERTSEDVLRDVTFSVRQGTIHAIVGGNGTGKTTLLKALCGTAKPYRGTIEIFGKSLSRYRKNELFRECLMMLPQDPCSLFVKNTVRDELSEMNSDKADIQKLAALCDVTHLLEYHPLDLSGGEQQRVALAKILMTHPKLLLLDEPTKGMDCFYKHKFSRILKQLTADGISVLLVSHDIEFCAVYADCVSMIFDGKVLSTETPQKFFSQNYFYTTAASRMSRQFISNAVTVSDVVTHFRSCEEE